METGTKNGAANGQEPLAGQQRTATQIDLGATESSHPGAAEQTAVPTETPAPAKGAWWKKKTILAGFAAMFLALIAFFATFSQNPSPPASSHTIVARVETQQAETVEQLDDFFVPLKDTEDKLMLQVLLEVRWPGEAKARFRRRRVAVRDEIYRRLEEVAGEGLIARDGDGIKYDQRAELEIELTRILQRLLETRQLKIQVRKAAFL